MVWDKVEFPCSVKTMHRLWDFAWKSHPALASFPSCSAPPTQEHFPKESLAGTPLSQDEPLSWNLPHPLPSSDHWVPLSLPPKYLWNLSGSFHPHCPHPRPDPLSHFHCSTIKASWMPVIYKSTLHMVVKRDFLKNKTLGTSLMIQWLRFHAPNAGGPGLISGQGTRSHMLQLKVCMRVCACVHVCVYVCVLSVTQLYLTLCDSIDLIIRQAPLSMGFSWQEYWSG